MKWSDGNKWFSFDPLNNPSDFVLLLEYFKVELEHYTLNEEPHVAATIWRGASFEKVFDKPSIKEATFEVVYKLINNRELEILNETN